MVRAVRAALLRKAREAIAERATPPPFHFEIASGAAAPQALPRGLKSGKVLLFRCLLDSPDKELGRAYFHQGSFYLASSLRKAGIEVLLSDLKITRLEARGAGGLAELGRLLEKHPDVSLAGVTLCDAYFEEAGALLGFLRARTRAFLAVGGIMPTHHAEEVLVHLPEAHFVVRGAGEEVLPRIAAICGSSDRRTGLSAEQRSALKGLEGVLFCDEAGLIWAAAEKALAVSDLDGSALDFSLVEKENVASGQVFSLSRGCRYGCRFCTSLDQGRFRGKSPENFAGLLSAYGRRLRELYGRWSLVPPAAFEIGFYDDDFLSDPERALRILDLVERSPFRVRFFQTAVRSLFGRRGAKAGGELDGRLLDAVQKSGARLYIGTESFCDRELKRLGKGYGCEEVERAALALSRRGIAQSHHFIVSNVHTGVEDLLESLVRIVGLQALCGAPFRVLEPVIAHLKSFPSTPSYRGLQREGLLPQVELRRRLQVAGFPEFDYPLVERDVPLDPDVREFAERVSGKTGIDWAAELDALLLKVLLRSETLRCEGRDPARARSLRRAADRFHRYHELAAA